MIEEVTPETLSDAGRVHALSWQSSHRAFCSPAFVAQNTPESHARSLGESMARGERTWLLRADGAPAGVVSVDGSLIENLYVLPEMQNRGLGSALLRFALTRCAGTPALWVLSVNEGAARLYRRFGFRETGARHTLSASIYEYEMRLESPPDGQSVPALHV